MRIAFVTVLAAAVLAGCGSADGSGIKPLQTASASPTATAASADPVAPASVKPTRPDDVKSGEGAEAYSIFVMQNVVYAISTNDVEPLLALSDGASCTTCVSLAKANKKRGDLVQIPTDDTDITDITVEKRDASSYVVRQTLKFPEVEITDVSSKKVTDTSAAADIQVTSIVVWKAGTWRLENYGTKEA